MLAAGIAAALLANVARADRGRAAVVGAVYTMDNAAGGNHVWAFGRRANGSLTAPAVVPTGGLGTGNALGNQGGVLLSRSGRWLFVCNAGSDEISVFAATPQGLTLTDKVSAEGHRPISLALHGHLLYVLNAGGADGSGKDTIAGFVFAFGQLQPLPGAVQDLSADNTAPAQIAFTRDGEALVVTEKATGLIDTFTVGDDGLIDGQRTFPSPAPPPFGFAAGRQDRLFVTEANGGAGNPGGGSVSAYEVQEDGSLAAISVSVPTLQTAACWLVLTRNERFAFTANTPSDSLSSFIVRHDGSLHLLKSEAGLTGVGSRPVDMALSVGNRFLYTLNSGNGTVGAFAVNTQNGSLHPLAGAAGLPVTANGLAAR